MKYLPLSSFLRHLFYLPIGLLGSLACNADWNREVVFPPFGHRVLAQQLLEGLGVATMGDVRDDSNDEELYSEMLELVYLGDLDGLRHFLLQHPYLDVNHVYQNGDRGDSLHGFTLLHQAALHHYVPMLDFLVGQGALLDAQDSEGQTPLHLSIIYGDSLRTIAALIHLGARIDIPNHEGLLPVHCAARHGHIRSLLLVLGQNLREERIRGQGDGFQRDARGRTFIHYAAAAGQVSVMKLWEELMRDGCLGYQIPTDHDYNNPLHLAAEAGHVNMIPFLLSCIAEPNLRGEFPMHRAAQHGNQGFVESLVERGAKLLVVDRRLHTPLHAAAEAGHLDLVLYFLNNGMDADCWMTRGLSFGPTPIELALRNGHNSTHQMLLGAANG